MEKNYLLYLNILYKSIHSTIVQKRKNIPYPLLRKYKRKYTRFINFDETIKILNRTKNNFTDYLINKNIKSKEGIKLDLIIYKNINISEFIDILNDYFKYNVLCKYCKGTDTYIINNLLNCNNCKSKYSVIFL